jgi:hypothetical protein
VYLRCFVVGDGGFFTRRKETKVRTLFIDPDIGTPLLRCLVPRDALISTAIVLLHFLVLAILCAGTFTQVRPSIVQCVMVSVVSFFSRTATKDQPMHVNPCPTPRSAINPPGVESIGGLVPDSVPIPLTQPRKILGIYDGILFFSEGDKTIGLVERLDNCMSLHAVFHQSSRQGLVKFSRYFSKREVCYA